MNSLMAPSPAPDFTLRPAARFSRTNWPYSVGSTTKGGWFSYAIGGAIAAYNYVEASATEDLDILVSFDKEEHRSVSGLVTLGPIVTYLFERGYTEFRAEGILVEGWPVQFLPVADELDAESLRDAAEIELVVNSQEGAVRTRILQPEHIIATALRTGRGKDRLRIMQFFDENAFEPEKLCDVLQRHELSDRWDAFCRATDVDNPCAPTSRTP